MNDLKKSFSADAFYCRDEDQTDCHNEDVLLPGSPEQMDNQTPTVLPRVNRPSALAICGSFALAERTNWGIKTSPVPLACLRISRPRTTLFESHDLSVLVGVR